MPQVPVVANSLFVGLDPVGIEDLGVVALPEVPVEAQRRNGRVGPPVADCEVAEIDVSDPLTRFGNERVRGTCVAVDDYRFVDVGGDSQRFWPLPDPRFGGPAPLEAIRNVRPPRSLRHTNSTSAPDARSSTMFGIA